jgi:hypothetical protein
MSADDASPKSDIPPMFAKDESATMTNLYEAIDVWKRLSTTQGVLNCEKKLISAYVEKVSWLKSKQSC